MERIFFRCTRAATGWALLMNMFVFATAVLAADTDERVAFFETRVRPLLAAKCLECHGDDKPEAGLRLTSREAMLQGGESGPAAEPGRPDGSRLIQAVRQAGELKMPPDGKLRADEIAALERWVGEGLAWPADSDAGTRKTLGTVTPTDRQHWAFQPLVECALPDVGEKNSELVPSDIDRFLWSKLQAAGLQYSPPADRRTLFRRVYYDLIGLPPDADEVDAFVADPAPTEEALARIVDRLLASPRYGERWGRHWLDVARFADTKDGVLMYGDDRIRPYAYTYRDYVVRAWNEDLPFDRFVHEQLAADLIEPRVEPWRLAALGWLTLGRLYDNNVHDVIDDQIDTIARGFFGLTVSCARCHDHKYDPIPQADYYSLYGVLASCEAPLELPLTRPIAEVSGGAEFEGQAAAKREELRKFVDEQFELLTETARQRTPDYLVKVATTPPDPLETAIFFLSLAPEDLRPPIVARWRRLLQVRATTDDPVFGPWRELMGLAESDYAARAAAVVRSWSDRPVGVEANQCNPLVRDALNNATSNGAALSGRADVARVYGELLRQTYEQSKGTGAGKAAANDEPARRQLLELLVGRESPAFFPKSQTRRYMSRQQTDAYGGKVKELDVMAVRSPHAPPRAMILVDAPVPHDPRVFLRGNPSQLGRAVPRQFLEVLVPSGKRQPFGQGSGRLDLARAITSPDNPLTARVIVNRVWMHHFGEPLVATPSDFGTRTAAPVHLELLDRLAAQLQRDGWSLKSLHRRIVLSRAYQQASTVDSHGANGRQVDPDNRLLWRMNRQRLDWEAMRDTLLAVSGRLELRSGGRPVDVAADPQARVRTVYGLVDRQSLPSVFRAFDFASPDVSIERRVRTMVPQQALFALNSPLMLTQAKSLAARPEVALAADSPARVKALYRATFGRTPTAEETADAVAFVESANEASTQLGRWEQLAQILLSTNELMYLD